MKIKEIIESAAQLNDIIKDAAELVPELFEGLYFTMHDGFTEAITPLRAESFEFYDDETDTSVKVSASVFWARTEHFTLEETEDWDAFDLVNILQIGVFGDIVYA